MTLGVTLAGSPGNAPLLDRLGHRHELWTSPWPGTVLAAAAVAGLALLLERHRRRRTMGLPARWVRAAGALAGVVALSLLSGAAFVNAYAGYLPTTAALEQAVGLAPALGASVSTSGTGSASSVDKINLPDRARGIPSADTFVYTPAGYADHPGTRYPVLYLVHGWPGGSQDWFRAAFLQQTLDAMIHAGVMSPAVVVTPDVNGGSPRDSECLDAVGSSQVETYLTTTVVSYVDSHYRTVADRAHRVIGGLSSGGYCALNLGLKHQDLLATVLAFEPYGDPGKQAFMTLLQGNRALYARNSPRAYLPTIPFPRPMAFFIDVGGASTAGDRRATKALADELAARGQKVQYRVEPGQAHTWAEAAAGLPYGLNFMAQQLASADAR